MNRQWKAGDPGSGRRTINGRVTAGLIAAAILMVRPGALFAQPPLPGRLELSGGLQWTGGIALGATAATESTPNGSRYPLFDTHSTLAPAPGVEGRVAVRVTDLVDVGFSATFAKSDLKSEIISDVEGFEATEAAESITHLSFEGSAAVGVPRFRLLGQGLPFVSGGVGFLRQLHEGRTLVETGTIYHVGGGLNYVLTSGGRGLFANSGVRLNARVVVRHKGVAFDGGSHVSPGFGVSFFTRF